MGGGPAPGVSSWQANLNGAQGGKAIIGGLVKTMIALIALIAFTRIGSDRHSPQSAPTAYFANPWFQ